MRSDFCMVTYRGWTVVAVFLREEKTSSLKLERELKNHLVGPASSVPSKPGISTPFTIDPQFNAAIRTIFEASMSIRRLEGNDFFWEGDANNKEERSCFLMYRFSTVNEAIIKSYIVISPPKLESDHLFTYRHFVWGSDDPDIRDGHVYRECDGAIFKSDKAYYFVGYNFVINSWKKPYPEEFKKKKN